VKKLLKEENGFMDGFQVCNLASHFPWNWSHVSPKSSSTFLGKNTHPFAIMSFFGQVVQERKIIQKKFLRNKRIYFPQILATFPNWTTSKEVAMP
jgi:hypothetical protein